MSPRGRPSRRQRERRVSAPPPIASERELVVEPGGDRLDRIVAAQMPELSRARVQQLIFEGLVVLEGRSAKASDRPRAGARVRVRLPEISNIRKSLRVCCRCSTTIRSCW